MLVRALCPRCPVWAAHVFYGFCCSAVLGSNITPAECSPGNDPAQNEDPSGSGAGATPLEDSFWDALLQGGANRREKQVASTSQTPGGLTEGGEQARAQASTNLMLLGDDDLSRAVAPYLPQGGQAPVNLPEGRPLTMGEEERLALVLNYHQHIGALLRDLDATSVLSYHFAEESAEDLAASALQHKEEELNDPEKLWVVYESLKHHGNSSRYYFRAVNWVRAERQVRNGDLSVRFIIEDDGEG
ncbi:hypothetical protein D1007_32413 [Hordeum vulgare]|nr:hypothetical protein D1007_32413 [Hordeum vulgare]